ncbi:ABC transporter substrate-binding protein [Paenibacillus humicola]|uniref:ABC transporter substrate-binding protein n=1 Tax=Paenibacillus humicola TaxID=3110540 RepID=UPI00237A5A1E|nr:ABC transporter substrate-binding protein [Paenibacillus humicola]
MRKTVSVLTAVVLTTGLVAGCSSGGGGGSTGSGTDTGSTGGSGDSKAGRTLTYWSPFSGDSQKWDQGRIEAFTKKTGIKVDVQFIAPDGGLSNGKLLAAISGGTVPDLVETSSPSRGYNFATEDSLMPWDPYLADIGFDSGSQALPGFKDLMKYDDKTYLLPQDSNVLLLYYNVDMFKEAGLDPDKPPKTIEELDQYAEKLTKVDNGKIERLGFVPWVDSGADPFTWLWMFGSKIYDPATKKLELTDDKSVNVFKWMNSYAQKYDPAKLKSFTSGFGGMFSPDHPFMTGKIAMTVTGNWFTNALKIYAPKVNYKVAKIPVPAGGREGGSPLYSNVFMIPKGAKNPDLAAEFVKFALTPEVNMDNFAQWRSIPITDDKFDEVTWTKEGDPIYKIEREEAKSENSGHPGLSPVSSELSDAITQLMDNVIYNNKDPKPLLQALQDKLQAEIDKG